MRFATASSLLLGAGFASLSAAKVDFAAAIEQISPGTKSCPDAGGECRTAAQAAPLILKSFRDYNVTCVQEAACLVSLMLLESGSFRYKHNVSPGRPGQGTANMQMVNFNLDYAKEVIPNLPPKFAQAKEGNALSDADKKELLALVTPDEHNFGSAAWFHNVKCDSAAVKTKMRDNAVEGCKAYLSECVGVGSTITPDRQQLNDKAFQAFGVSSAAKCVPLWDC
ncbi:hypothetical protein HIM_03346 [Hirsutella minnesotensis 3608]|uniref:Uncharacterized protein n=1 Tax=Hirsutella minnesotensis 3608 TaxID=1043627 RepID=A0A0F7ZQC8_9HYPO|nr:hypothetical protein HIM_03346 [Hirsutella minnesotensis 3608]